MLVAFCSIVVQCVHNDKPINRSIKHLADVGTAWEDAMVIIVQDCSKKEIPRRRASLAAESGIRPRN